LFLISGIEKTSLFYFFAQDFQDICFQIKYPPMGLGVGVGLGWPTPSGILVGRVDFFFNFLLSCEIRSSNQRIFFSLALRSQVPKS
jgi:hypothetical protein